MKILGPLPNSQENLGSAPKPTWKSWIWPKIQQLVWVRPPQLKNLGPLLIHTILLIFVCYSLGTKEFILDEGREPVTTISTSSNFFPWADPSVATPVQSHLRDSRMPLIRSQNENPAVTSSCCQLLALCFTAFVYSYHIHPCPQKREFWVVDFDMLNGHPSMGSPLIKKIKCCRVRGQSRHGHELTWPI